MNGVGRIAEAWSPASRLAAERARKLKHVSKFTDLGATHRPGYMAGSRTPNFSRGAHRQEVARIPMHSMVHYEHGGERERGILVQHEHGVVHVQGPGGKIAKVAHRRVKGYQAPVRAKKPKPEAIPDFRSALRAAVRPA